MSLRALTLFLLMASWPAAGLAQGLGDAAAREAQKRAKPAKDPKAAPVRLITNDDLEKGRPPGAKKTEGAGTASAAPAGGETAETTPSEPINDRNTEERSYLDAITGAQARVSAAEARIQELNGRLNPQSTTFIYGPMGSNSANDELQVRAQLNAAEQELNAARQSLAEAQKALQGAREGRPVKPQ